MVGTGIKTSQVSCSSCKLYCSSDDLLQVFEDNSAPVNPWMYAGQAECSMPLWLGLMNMAPLWHPGAPWGPKLAVWKWGTAKRVRSSSYLPTSSISMLHDLRGRPDLWIWLVVFSHPSEKYEYIPNIWENKTWQPNHQPDFGYLLNKDEENPMTFDGKNHFDPPAPGESPSFLQTSPSALEISWFEGTSTRNSRNHRFFSRKHGRVIEKQSLKPIHGQLDEMTSFSRVPQHDPPTRLLPASLSGVELPTTSPRPRWWYNLAKWVSWGGTSWSQSLVGDLGGTWKPEILTLEKGQIIGQFKPIDFNRTGSAMPSNIAQWSGWFHHMSTYLAQFNQFFKYVQCSFMEYAAVVKHFSTRAKSSKEQISPGTSQALRAG